jgi:hypothetical protein
MYPIIQIFKEVKSPLNYSYYAAKILVPDEDVRHGYILSRMRDKHCLLGEMNNLALYIPNCTIEVHEMTEDEYLSKDKNDTNNEF